MQMVRRKSYNGVWRSTRRDGQLNIRAMYQFSFHWFNATKPKCWQSLNSRFWMLSKQKRIHWVRAKNLIFGWNDCYKCRVGNCEFCPRSMAKNLWIHKVHWKRFSIGYIQRTAIRRSIGYRLSNSLFPTRILLLIDNFLWSLCSRWYGQIIYTVKDFGSQNINISNLFLDKHNGSEESRTISCSTMQVSWRLWVSFMRYKEKWLDLIDLIKNPQNA